MRQSQHPYAEPVPRLLIPTPRFGEAPAIELLARLAAVMLLLVIWVGILWIAVATLSPRSETLPSNVEQVVEPRGGLNA